MSRDSLGKLWPKPSLHICKQDHFRAWDEYDCDLKLGTTEVCHYMEWSYYNSIFDVSHLFYSIMENLWCICDIKKWNRSYTFYISLHWCCDQDSSTLLDWHSYLSNNFVRTFHLEEEQHYILHTVFPNLYFFEGCSRPASMKWWFSGIHFDATDQFSSKLSLCRRGWSADNPVYFILTLTFSVTCVLLEVCLRRSCVLISDPCMWSSVPRSRWRDCRVPKQL